MIHSTLPEKKQVLIKVQMSEKGRAEGALGRKQLVRYAVISLSKIKINITRVRKLASYQAGLDEASFILTSFQDTYKFSALCSVPCVCTWHVCGCLPG